MQSVSSSAMTQDRACIARPAHSTAGGSITGPLFFCSFHLAPLATTPCIHIDHAADVLQPNQRIRLSMGNNHHDGVIVAATLAGILMLANSTSHDNEPTSLLFFP